jgi:uncharacterized protein
LIYIVAGIILFLIFIFVKANQNTKSVIINTINVPNSHGDQPLTILHLSDIHLENISITPNELFQNVANMPIDLIALTGDYLERKSNIPKLIPYLQKLNDLNPRLGIYAVFGNHDYYLKDEHFALLKNTLEEHGCITLQNESTSLQNHGKTLNIIGIDDHHSKRDDASKAYKDLPNGYNLVLTHDPNIVLKMKSYKYDYLLSGHFHGGQIHWPKPYHLLKMGKLVRMNMIKGLHFHDGKPFYISEGLGQTGVNIRIGSRPEITVHQI